MKGDTSVWSASHFWINARRDPSSVSPFEMKCKMLPWYVCHPYKEKRDTCTRGTSRIRSPWPQIPGTMLSLSTLSNFSLPPSALTQDTVRPPPLVVLDPGPGSRRYLIPGLIAHSRLDPLIAHSRLDPGLGACRRRPLPQVLDTVAPPLLTSTSPSSKCTTAVIFLRACHRHRPRPHLPQYEALNSFSS
jgi:hypothetical protein